MRLSATYSVDAQAVKLHAGLLLIEALHGFVIDGEYLGSYERGRSGNVYEQHLKTAYHVLVLRFAGVLVVFALSVVYHILQNDGHIVVVFQIFQQLCRICGEKPLIGSDLRREFLRLAEILLPCGVGGVKILDRPLVLCWYLVSLWDPF